MDIHNPPILVTGSHRSGSTFIGRMLSLHPSVGYIFEPFNIRHGIEGVDKQFIYIKEGMADEEKYAHLVEQILTGKAKYKSTYSADEDSILKSVGKKLLKSGTNYLYLKAKYNPKVKRLLIKDPIACMSSEWFHQKFGMNVVVIMRHPAAFVSSIKRLNWGSSLTDFMNQEHLVKDHLHPYLAGIDEEKLSVVERLSIIWNCIHSVLLTYVERNPAMIMVRHEDVSMNPIAEFRKLYEALDIEFTPHIERKLKKFTNPDNPVDPTNNDVHVLKRNSKDNATRWKSLLTDYEIGQIKEMTKPVAEQIYSESEW